MKILKGVLMLQIELMSYGRKHKRFFIHGCMEVSSPSEV